MDLDEDDTPPLLRAAYAGDVHALRQAIADGADLDVEGEVGLHGPHTPRRDLYPQVHVAPRRGRPNHRRVLGGLRRPLAPCS